MTTRLVLWGARGRMGSAIDALCADDPRFEVVARVDQGDAPPKVEGKVVIIDFTSPQGFGGGLRFAATRGSPFVSGTTGLQPEALHALQDVSRIIPVLHAPNMSLGVTLMRVLTRAAAQALPNSFEAEILEIHHSRKVDAPSGTALALAESIQAARPDTAAHHGRSGLSGPRTPQEMGIHAVRGGDVVGEHTVLFLGPGERLELVHRATDRSIFARGALTAAEWIQGQPAGQWTMEDVLGLSHSVTGGPR